jgi:hypothetical protein
MHQSRDSLVKFIDATIKNRGMTLRSASKAIGRNDAYLQQFVGKKRSPEVLPEDARHALAAVLRVDERELRLASQKVDRSSNVLQDKDVSEEFNLPAVYENAQSRREAVHMGDTVGNEALIKDLMSQVRDIATRMTRIEGAVFGTDPGVVPNKLGPPSRRKA